MSQEYDHDEHLPIQRIRKKSGLTKNKQKERQKKRLEKEDTREEKEQNKGKSAANKRRFLDLIRKCRTTWPVYVKEITMLGCTLSNDREVPIMIKSSKEGMYDFIEQHGNYTHVVVVVHDARSEKSIAKYFFDQLGKHVRARYPELLCD